MRAKNPPEIAKTSRISIKVSGNELAWIHQVQKRTRESGVSAMVLRLIAMKSRRMGIEVPGTIMERVYGRVAQVAGKGTKA